MNKTIIWGVVAMVIILGGAYLFMGSASAPTSTNSTPTTQGQTGNAQGRVVFSVTDAALNMNTISEINMNVSSVDAHSTTRGWVNVTSTPQTYSLLALNSKNQSQLLADMNLKADTYDQVRLMVDSISVKTKAGATSDAKLPSGDLRINTKLVVGADTTSSVNFDFLADKSLHTTGSGAYIFAPVVKTEVKDSTNVTVNGDNTVTVVGGNVEDSNSVGMDVDGSVKANFQIDSNAKLNVGSDNTINIDTSGLLK